MGTVSGMGRGWGRAVSPPLTLPTCPLPQKFLFFVLKSSDVLDILVPTLYFLNDARADQCKAGVGTRSWEASW